MSREVVPRFALRGSVGYHLNNLQLRTEVLILTMISGWHPSMKQRVGPRQLAVVGRAIFKGREFIKNKVHKCWRAFTMDNFALDARQEGKIYVQISGTISPSPS